jgi:L-amino acid N-acyltransferase YncA
VIRTGSIRLLLGVHRAYEDLSARSKSYFHPGFLGRAALSRTGVAAAAAMVLSTLPSLRRLLWHLVPAATFVWVAAVECERVIGFAYVKGMRGRRGRGRRGELGIFVSDQWAGRGVGRALLGTVLEQARSVGFSEIYLRVYADNEPAMRVYREFGFQELVSGTQGGDSLGAGRQVIEMLLRLEAK